MAAAPLPANLAKIIQKFQRAKDSKQRYEQLIWYANRLKGMPEEAKTPDNKVPGCVSQVFITADLLEGRVFYQGESDAQLVKGLVAVLIEGLNGSTPEEITAIEPDFIQDMGLNTSLTPSRANGFYNIFQTMQKKALGYKIATQPEGNGG